MTLTTWNQHVVKKENKAIVINMIKEHFPISRAEIAQKTGLNKGTVSSLVAELINDHLVTESGPGISSGGRRPVLLLFNQVAGYSIGITLEVNYILGILTDFQGNIIIEKNDPHSPQSVEETMNQLKELIAYLIKSAPHSSYGIVGISIGVPGIVNKDGDILLAPNLGWKNVSVKGELEAAFHIPVLIENEANLGAYGEKKFGSGQGIENLIYISMGIGLGSGIIINGELYKGTNGFSGELGHMTIDSNGPKCRCGNNGCWELYASEKALLNKGKKQQDLHLDELLKLAQSFDPSVLSSFQEIGHYLGIGMINIIHTFNPQKIIIGNRMANAQAFLEDQVEYTIKKHILPLYELKTEIAFSRLPIHSSTLGASAISTENFLNSYLFKQK
ncbi:ROK family protein [Peribacillus muralis]|uniref:ROK family transcriptional regulator n=1 Tax=Peribacillus muralis TaxID=264697 RepID=UPI001F4EC6DC|nr:ROK family transcriptional regulator [Peribacillus muralis]MCK1993387.1 ROK family transcriptional regulator [Peribacillus muralis]MCK2014325.1 ROK family transcriptional regulator [Peribacillus muralis]